MVPVSRPERPSMGVQRSQRPRRVRRLTATILGALAAAVLLGAVHSRVMRTPRLRQLAKETGARVVTDLYIHSLGPNAATYIDMMKWNTKLIVEALR